MHVSAYMFNIPYHYTYIHISLYVYIILMTNCKHNAILQFPVVILFLLISVDI